MKTQIKNQKIIMDAIFLSFLTVFLIIVQSVIFPSLSFFHQSFDVLLIVVLLISISFTHHSVILAIAVLGWIMDSISGLAFFLNTFSYLLIYMIVALSKHMIFKRSIVFIMIISFAGVIIQNGLIVFSVFISQGIEALLAFDYVLIIKQAFWAIIFIPPSVLLVQKFQKELKLMIAKIRRQSPE
jgi:cell shape-determining protein MreD